MREVELPRPAPSQDCHANDQAPWPDTLNIFWAAAVLDDLFRPNLRPTHEGDLPQSDRAFDRPLRSAACERQYNS